MGFNKAGVALVTAVSLWAIRATCGDEAAIAVEASSAVSEVAEARSGAYATRPLKQRAPEPL